MNDVFSGSLYFGFFLSLFAYYLGIKIRKVFRLGIFNPLGGDCADHRFPECDKDPL